MGWLLPRLARPSGGRADIVPRACVGSRVLKIAIGSQRQDGSYIEMRNGALSAGEANHHAGETDSKRIGLIMTTKELAMASGDPVTGTDAGDRAFEFSLLDAVLGILKRKRAMAGIVAGSSLFFVIVSFLMPVMYTSTTKLMPPQQNQSIASSIMGQLGPLAGLAGKQLGTQNPSELYIALLQSRTLQDTLADKFHLKSVYNAKLMEDARRKLNSRSEIVASKEGIISIAVRDRDPRRAADLANGYVSALMNLNQNLAISEAGQRRLFFQQQLEAEKNTLSDAEVALKQSEEKSGLIQLDSQARAEIEKNTSLEAQIAATDVELKSMSSFATADNPDYVNAQQRLAALDAELAKSKAKQGPDSLELGTAAIPALGLEYVRRVRDVKYHEALYELLMQQFEAARIDEAKSASVIQVLDKGLVPERKSSPRRAAYLAIGFLVGLVTAVGWAVAAEITAKASRSPELGIKLDEIAGHLKIGRTLRGGSRLDSR